MAKGNEINDILSQGNAISKVMTGGGIVWHKLYKWRVYNLKTVNVYKYKLNKEGTWHRIHNWVTLYQDIEINGNTGEITLKNEENRSDYGYTEDDGSIYYGSRENSVSTGSSYFQAEYHYTASKYVYKSYKEKDSYVKEVSSNLIETYPLNGIEGEYWYEFIG